MQLANGTNRLFCFSSGKFTSGKAWFKLHPRFSRPENAFTALSRRTCSQWTDRSSPGGVLLVNSVPAFSAVDTVRISPGAVVQSRRNLAGGDVPATYAAVIGGQTSKHVGDFPSRFVGSASTALEAFSVRGAGNAATVIGAAIALVGGSVVEVVRPAAVCPLLASPGGCE